jgi:hypothetical protein
VVAPKPRGDPYLRGDFGQPGQPDEKKAKQRAIGVESNPGASWGCYPLIARRSEVLSLKGMQAFAGGYPSRRMLLADAI